MTLPMRRNAGLARNDPGPLRSCAPGKQRWRGSARGGARGGACTGATSGAGPGGSQAEPSPGEAPAELQSGKASRLGPGGDAARVLGLGPLLRRASRGGEGAGPHDAARRRAGTPVPAFAPAGSRPLLHLNPYPTPPRFARARSSPTPPVLLPRTLPAPPSPPSLLPRFSRLFMSWFGAAGPSQPKLSPFPHFPPQIQGLRSGRVRTLCRHISSLSSNLGGGKHRSASQM